MLRFLQQKKSYSLNSYCCDELCFVKRDYTNKYILKRSRSIKLHIRDNTILESWSLEWDNLVHVKYNNFVLFTYLFTHITSELNAKGGSRWGS